MKDKLAQIEKHLQNFIEKNTILIFGSPDAEVKLASSLVKAMKEQIRIETNGSITAPNIFSLNVPIDYIADIRTNQTLLNTLGATLMKAGEQAGIAFEANLTINVFPDEQLKEGEFSVKAMWKEPMVSETQSLEVSVENDPVPNIPPKSFLIVGGSKIFTLEKDVINIGRKLENHLVIDDPRVSRKHGQLRAIKGRYMLFDLNSSGGIYVNGERIKQITLHPGDVISLAGVPIVYGQDAVRAISETQEYTSPENASNADSTTTSVELNQLDLDNFDK